MSSLVGFIPSPTTGVWNIGAFPIRAYALCILLAWQRRGRSDWHKRLIFIGTFFQMVLMIAENVRAVPIAQIEAAQTMGATREEMIRLVIFPSSRPAIVDTLRITMGWAWTYLVVAELVAANSGLGYAILKAQRYLQTDRIFGGILLIGLIGLMIDQVFRLVHRLCFGKWMAKR